MRLSGFEIRNYKGIAFAKADGLADESIITISGRNGTGKSLLLEAITLVLSTQSNSSSYVGPWADSTAVNISLSFTDDEWQSIIDWDRRYGDGSVTPGDREPCTLAVAINHAGIPQQVRNSPVARVIGNRSFRKDHPFVRVDFLPATRVMPEDRSTAVDLKMLSFDKASEERDQMLQRFVQTRAPMPLPSVESYLLSLDYQAFVATRQGSEHDNDYDRIAAVFYAATGKSLPKPTYDAISASTGINVELPTGHRHKLIDLSSGEQEMLAMMHFVRRLSATGGILCIDEPELHLHPTLQAALFEAMKGLAARAQILVVSHSVPIITAAPTSGLIQMSAPLTSQRNQVQRLTDDPAMLDLIAVLGVTPADLYQSDLLLVVEGETDAQWLKKLFPVELGRARVMAAGSSKQVRAAHETLSRFPVGIPWLCLIDRDLRTEEESREVRSRYDHLFVWPRREIESMVIDARLISAVVTGNGKDITEPDVAAIMRKIANELCEEVAASLLDAELHRRFPGPGKQTSGSRLDRMEQRLRGYARMNGDRAGALREVYGALRTRLDADWESDWPILVDPKPMFAGLSQRLGVFRSGDDLLNALFARAGADPSVRPAQLDDFGQRLRSLLEARESVARPTSVAQETLQLQL